MPGMSSIMMSGLDAYPSKKSVSLCNAATFRQYSTPTDDQRKRWQPSSRNLCKASRAPSSKCPCASTSVRSTSMNMFAFFKRRGMWPNDPKLSHGHWKVTPKCNRDNQISYHRRNCKGSGRWLQPGVRHLVNHNSISVKPNVSMNRTDCLANKLKNCLQMPLNLWLMLLS